MSFQLSSFFRPSVLIFVSPHRRKTGNFKAATVCARYSMAHYSICMRCRCPWQKNVIVQDFVVTYQLFCYSHVYFCTFQRSVLFSSRFHLDDHFSIRPYLFSEKSRKMYSGKYCVGFSLRHLLCPPPISPVPQPLCCFSRESGTAVLSICIYLRGLFKLGCYNLCISKNFNEKTSFMWVQ